MIKLASTSLVAVALGLGLTLAAGSAFAGVKPPPKKEPADCSPGYWKNHVEVWCGDTCPSGAPPSISSDPAVCEFIRHSLSRDEGSPTATVRFFDRFLDGCYGTAEESPCTED